MLTSIGWRWKGRWEDRLDDESTINNFSMFPYLATWQPLAASSVKTHKHILYFILLKPATLQSDWNSAGHDFFHSAYRLVVEVLSSSSQLYLNTLHTLSPTCPPQTLWKWGGMFLLWGTSFSSWCLSSLLYFSILSSHS